MNNIYLYDGDFSSLLALINEIIDIKKPIYDIKSEEEYMPSLFDETIYLEINNKKESERKLVSKLSNIIISYAYYVYLSTNINKEKIIFYFIKNALIYKDKVFYYRKLNCVNDTIKISNYVSREAHKLKGFLRFKEMKNNFYYATISPTNNVIGILANHFKKRLSNQNWIIKDTKRKIYALYDMDKVIFLSELDVIKLNLDLSTDENFVEDLWKTFFETISIKERTNLRCQRNFMPKKYWNNIIEMEDKI